jgi:hypothetical protein
MEHTPHSEACAVRLRGIDRGRKLTYHVHARYTRWTRLELDTDCGYATAAGYVEE